jgi:para-nitrobenzyl esterase
MMASQHARGLFHRAIGQSGGAVTPLGHPGGGSLVSFEDSEKLGLRVAASFGKCTIEELREIPAHQIQLSWPKDPEFRPWATIDGYVLTESPYDTFVQGRQYDVPLLTGANADEGATRVPAATAAQWQVTLQRAYGEDAPLIFEMYGGESDVDTMSRRQAGHITFNWVNWTWARLQATTGRSPVFFYHFDRRPPLPPGEIFFENDARRLGAFHTSEIPYVFANLSKRPWPWQDFDFRVSEMMSTYWVNFAARGNPNGSNLPQWPCFDAQLPSVLLISEQISTGELPERKKLDLWDVCMRHRRARNPQGKLALM